MIIDGDGFMVLWGGAAWAGDIMSGLGPIHEWAGLWVLRAGSSCIMVMVLINSSINGV